MQPKLTSNNTATADGTIVTTAHSIYQSSYAPYCAMDGTNTCWGPAENAGAIVWWQVKFPYYLKVTKITYRTSHWSGHRRDCTFRFYTNSNRTIPIGDVMTAPNIVSSNLDVTGIPTNGIVTDTLYWYCTERGAAITGIGELTISATKIVGARAEDNLWASSAASKYIIKY